MTKFEIANTVYYTGDSETHYTCYDCEVYASKESLDSSDGYMVQLTEGDAWICCIHVGTWDGRISVLRTIHICPSRTHERV